VPADQGGRYDRILREQIAQLAARSGSEISQRRSRAREGNQAMYIGIGTIVIIVIIVLVILLLRRRV
jgi:predicted phosphoribosyltransferase